MRSVVVVLPASMWAAMPMLRVVFSPFSSIYPWCARAGGLPAARSALCFLMTLKSRDLWCCSARDS
jgi:hypothetical protein